MDKRTKKTVSVGDVFGHWVVLELLPSNVAAKAKARCRCRCGAEYEVYIHNMKYGLSSQCKKCGSLESGEKRRQDITGKRECGCVVEERLDTYHARVRCRCGDVRTVTTYSINNGRLLCRKCQTYKSKVIATLPDGTECRIRDCMRLLGVSRQRIHQMSKSRLVDRLSKFSKSDLQRGQG